MNTQRSCFITSHHVRLKATITFVGNDISVVITGPDKIGSHIGCVCIGIPHEGISDKNTTSATVSTHNITGHRDDVIAVPIAKNLAASFNCVCIVTCGIHIDNATPDEISQIMQMSEKLLAKIKESVLLYKQNELRTIIK